jgi:tetratricopeptide (TPR) repeat protein
MRKILTLVLLVSLQGVASAETSTTTSQSVEVPKLSPAQARALRLDQLFGELHQQGLGENAVQAEAEIWRLWAKNDSPTAEALIANASIAMAVRDYDASEQILTQLIETYPSFAEGWNRRAILYFAIKRYDASLIDIGHVLELEPRHFGALAGKGMILRAQGKHDQALAAFNDALTMDPHMETVKAAIKDLEKVDPKI